MPLFGTLSGALMLALGDDDDDPMTKIREQFSNPFTRDLVSHGVIGAFTGTDITGSIATEFPKSWSDLIGVPYSVLQDTTNTVKSLSSGQPLRAASETPITPTAIKNAIRALQLSDTGQLSRSGRDINYPGQTGALKLDSLEAFLKGVIGLQPLTLSKSYASYQAAEKFTGAIADRKRGWADRYVNAIRQNDKRGQIAVQKEVNLWNQQARRDGKPALIVNLKGMIKNRLQPNNLRSYPKQVRGEVRGISNIWQ
jgi:hypothetical protein